MVMTYCDVCGRECRSAGTPPVPACPEHGPRWKLARSAPATDVVIVRDGKVLMDRRAIEPEQGLWEFPGGFADRGEHPATTARREVREELGIEIRLTGILGIYMEEYLDDIVQVTVYTAETDDEPGEGDGEILEWRWFGPDELPAESEVAFRHYLRITDWLRTQHGLPPEGLALD